MNRVLQLLAKNLYLYPKKYSGEVFNAGTNVKYKIISSINLYGWNEKAKKELKWHPKHSFKDGIKKTIN